jgi:cell division protein FtsW (lipid II flippase)
VVVAAALLPYRRLLDLAWPVWTAAMLLLVAVLVVGDMRNGARRWIQLGPIGFQPSEFAKVAHVLVLARYIRFRRDHRTFKGLFVPFLITLVPMALVLMEPDLGTATMFVPVLFASLWVAGARTRHLLAVVGLGIASLPLLYFAMPSDHYQKQRLHAFLPVLATAEGRTRKPDTLQRDTAIAAVAAGGATGRSSEAEETPRHDRVPESWTDFAFVVHAENWGFFGVALLLGLWTALLSGLSLCASEIKEPAGRLLCVGAMVLLGTQAGVNMAMTMGLLPITGVPLPFVSYGGSAMLAAWMLLGLALNAKARQPMVFSVRDFD